MLHYLLDRPDAVEKITSIVTGVEYEPEVDENQVEHDHPYVSRLFRCMLQRNLKFSESDSLLNIPTIALRSGDLENVLKLMGLS